MSDAEWCLVCDDALTVDSYMCQACLDDWTACRPNYDGWSDWLLSRRDPLRRLAGDLNRELSGG